MGKISVLNMSGESIVVDTSDGSIQREGLILVTHLVINNFAKDGKKQKVFFVVQNERGYFYWGTEDNELDLDVILRYVKNGTLKELKEPILIKHGKGLWCGGVEDLYLYVGDKVQGSPPFYTILLGKFYDLVID